MPRKCIWLILAGLITSSSGHTLDMPNLPFFTNKYNFVIDLQANKPLQALLAQELAAQRKNNRQLQQYSTPQKIVQYESKLLTERLRAEGYYASAIHPHIQEGKIIYRIVPGSVYLIEQLTVTLPDQIAIPVPALDIHEGSPLRSEMVLAAKKTLSDTIAAQTCLYEIEVAYQAKVFHETRTAQLIYSVKPSPSVSFGEISFTGLKTINESYLEKLTGITSGECFKRKHLDAARLKLMQSNLLAHVDVQASEPVNNKVDINFKVTERFHRTISAGGSYQLDQGFGLSAGWQHRNFSGQAEKLTVDSLLARNRQRLSTNFTLPNFHRNDQSITFYGDLEAEDTDAYESKLAKAGTELSRQLQPALKGLVGAEMEFSEITENNKTETFALFSLPLSLEQDERDDFLGPKKGWVAATTVRPYWDAHNAGRGFVKATIASSVYLNFGQFPWQPVLAVRGAVGTIIGADHGQVPANIRYYVGGGGSVRGYPFQTLGSMTDGDPDGGLSFNEFSIETRLHFGSNWGGVVFIDGGYAYRQSTPQFGQNLHWGAGVGVRYYTNFAPIRFDIALPLNKRDGIDDSFQIYVSIGQAF